MRNAISSMTAIGEIHTTWGDFDGLGHFYQFRPEYPQQIAEQLRSALGDSSSGRIIEVGAGTGLFTRSLAAVFGPGFRIVALEPNEDMRRHAEQQTPASMRVRVRYAEGIAEDLQAADGTVELVTAASAVHRFDRPAFYREARRVLAPGGVVAIVQYEPYDRGSAFADGFLSVIEAALPSYQRHRHSRPEGGYAEVDIVFELAGETGLEDVTRDTFVFKEPIDRERFEQRARSFTIVQKAIARRGEEAILSALGRLFERHRDRSGFVEMPYEAEIIMARRA
jgi:ubiquinone/menaquinone biosynthesis C-methylase UbiE